MRLSSKFLAVLACLVAPVVSSCGSLQAGTSAPATAAQPAAPLDRATLAYARVRAVAIEAEPFLPADIASRVRDSITLGDLALAAAQQEASPTTRNEALTKLASAIAVIVSAVAAHR